MNWRDRQEESLKQAQDPVAAMELMDFMSEISENYYCAGWLIGLEYRLWDILQGGDPRFGFSDVRDFELAHLRDLHERAGGWWYWQDSPDPGDGGEIFLTTAAWLIKYVQDTAKT